MPIRVDLVLSRERTLLLTSPQTAQYLPMGELLGSIPGNNARGAWARVIGLGLASFWRRLPRESLDGTIKPTRRELLERYPPKTGPVSEVLNSKDPKHAVLHWCNAINMLVEVGFIEKVGEALISATQMRANLPRQDWTESWLNDTVDLRPGPQMRSAVETREKALLPASPTPKRRGRPQKLPTK